RFKCDWSSDVCSSDLAADELRPEGLRNRSGGRTAARRGTLRPLLGFRWPMRPSRFRKILAAAPPGPGAHRLAFTATGQRAQEGEIGRASCRERVESGE